MKTPWIALGTRLTLSVALLLGLGAASMLSPDGTQAAPVRNSFSIAPQAYKNGISYGTGIYFAPHTFTVYTQPSETSPSVGKFHWDAKTNTNSLDVLTPDGQHHAVYADRVFFYFYPQSEVAMMAVTGDDTDNGWVEVIYNQDNHKTGWVHLKAPAKPNGDSSSLPTLPNEEPTYFGIYQTWLEFMKLNAKSNGVYWLSGVKEYNRSLRSADTDDAKLIPITIIRKLTVKHIRGNWMLVEVLDFEHNTPLGWMRWRDDDGNLMVFPNLMNQHVPIITTAY